MRIVPTMVLLAMFVCACATTHAPSSFLQTDHAGWNGYLDEQVGIDVDSASLVDLFCQTPALADLSVVVRPQVRPKTGMYEEVSANAPYDDQEETRLDRMRVSMHADRVSRRDLLYRISRECNIDMSWDLSNGVPRAVALVFRKGR